ncbi:MAG: deoxynucleoside kinase [Mariniphaga sp.]|nr:deoxynucleoside kinase [Mariniphaga sp.]
MQFIAIEGNIGAGKTTLAKMLSDDLQAKLILEQFADNPFLPKFYKDQDRYSFPLELSFLADRYNQIKKEIFNRDLFYPLVIADYYFSKTRVFAQNTLKRDEYHLFKKIFDMVSESIPKPDLYVYLHADTQKLLENIKKRGRDYEGDISESYLDHIREGYFNYMKQVRSFPVLVVDINKIDFVRNNSHYEMIREVLFKSEYKLGLNRLILS